MKNLIFLLLTTTLFSYDPWFTDPFLAPTPTNPTPGHPYIQASVTTFNNYGHYDSHWKSKKQAAVFSINPFLNFQLGLTDRFGLQIDLSSLTNYRRGQTSTHLQDTTLFLGYQISNDDPNSWVPNFRILLQETFPTGKYQKLDPRKHQIDSTGFGSFQTGPTLVLEKLFSLSHHFLALEWSITYLFPAPVHVKGYNTYGGSTHTHGKVRPGQTLTAFFSGEYSFTQHWAFAFDTQYVHQRTSHFSGYTAGAPVGLPPSTQLSFAPEIEYNFSLNSGLILGAWATLLGKNSPVFNALFVAFDYTF